MKTALITGVNGFAGRHLAQLLMSQRFKVYGTTRLTPTFFSENSIDELIVSDMGNKEECVQVLTTVKPDVIFHLAAQSNVKEAWEQPSDTFFSNTVKTMYLFEAVKQVSRNIRIISIGSSEEYGYSKQMEFPITENSMLNPTNPYGVSKMSAGLMAKQFFEGFGMDIIHVRPFNHIGPGQKKGFVVPDFAHQIVNIEKGRQKPVISVGNLSSLRDFTDVRDIVNGYRLIAEMGIKGQTYNLCSGKPTSIEDLLLAMISLSPSEITIEVNPDKLRPVDIPIYYGSNDKVINQTSWERGIDLNRSLEDILEEIRKEEWLEKL